MPIDERDPLPDYDLSVYSRQGHKVGELSGALKTVLDPFMVYRNYPNQKTSSFVIDSDGFRDGHVNEGAERLAFVMGASNTFGHGLAHSDQTFTSKLSHANPDTRFINAGVVGILSGQELAQMVHYLDRDSPALYISMNGWNDVFDAHMYVTDHPPAAGPIGFNNTFIVVEHRLDELHRVRLGDADLDYEPVRATPDYGDMETYTQAVHDTYIANIDKMNSFARARGAKFLLVFQPDIARKTTRTESEDGILRRFDEKLRYRELQIPEKYEHLVEVAQAFCKARGIVCVNPNEIPSFAENPESMVGDMAHLSARGHEVIAEIISDVMSEGID